MTDFSTLSPYRPSQGVPQPGASPAGPGVRNYWSFFFQSKICNGPYYWGVRNNEVSAMREFAVLHQGN